MNFPEELLYAKTHEWGKKEGENVVRIGIISYAQSQLGEVVYVELPALDSIVETGKACAVIESAKAAYDILAPVSGKVTKTNNNLEDNAQLVNEDPYGEGWFFIVELEYPQQLKNLLSYKEYEELCQTK